jgi:uncharacterized membrane protein
MLLVCLLVVATACGGAKKMASAPMTAATAHPMQPQPAPLDRSLFARTPQGALTEEALQKILASPIELDLPARVGVLPVLTATDWRGPGPDHRVPPGVAPFVAKLRKDPAFSLVTQTMVIPSGALGMEALREIAARYRLRYVLLYREVLAKDRRLGPWAWGYLTGIGALFLPGQKQEVYGYIEASMFDVKTGLLMFTTRRSIHATQTTNQWNKQLKLEKLAANATAKFAPDLAHDVQQDLRRFAAAAIAENTKRPRDGEVAVEVPPMPAEPVIATDPKPAAPIH